MYPQKLICDHSDCANLLDLPEIIFRTIFKNLDDHVVWFTVSNICRKIRYYVKNYIKLGNVFLDVYTTYVNKVTETLYIFKKFDQVQSIYCTTISSKTRHLCFSDFGVVTPEKAVLGRISILQRRNVLQGIRHILFKNKETRGEFVELWEINSKQHTWKAFPENHKFCSGYMHHWSYDHVECSCPMGQSKILLNVRWPIVRHDMDEWSSFQHSPREFLLIDFKVENKNKCMRRHEHGLYVKSIKSIPVQWNGHRFEGIKVVSMFSISQENILIIGMGRKSCITYRNVLMLWKGGLRKNKLHLELLKVKDIRSNSVSVCFIMKMSLYIVRDHYCDMFDIEEGEYREKVFHFPYFEENQGMHHTAITDANETFVLILLDKFDTNRAIIFTETEGFKDINIMYTNKFTRTKIDEYVGKHILLPVG